MSSLDQVHEDMTAFVLAFREFNEDLRLSLATLRDRHEDIAGLWTDEAARTYEAQFGPFEEMLEQYVGQEGPRLEDYIEEKLRLLARYLHGD